MWNFNTDGHASRRQFLVGSAAAAAAVTTLPRDIFTASFHNFAHGAFDITVLSDGFITLPPEVLLPDAEPEEGPTFSSDLAAARKGLLFRRTSH